MFPQAGLPVYLRKSDWTRWWARWAGLGVGFGSGGPAGLGWARLLWVYFDLIDLLALFGVYAGIIFPVRCLTTLMGIKPYWYLASVFFSRRDETDAFGKVATEGDGGRHGCLLAQGWQHPQVVDAMIVRRLLFWKHVFLKRLSVWSFVYAMKLQNTHFDSQVWTWYYNMLELFRCPAPWPRSLWSP